MTIPKLYRKWNSNRRSPLLNSAEVNLPPLLSLLLFARNRIHALRTRAGATPNLEAGFLRDCCASPMALQFTEFYLGNTQRRLWPCRGPLCSYFSINSGSPLRIWLVLTFSPGPNLQPLQIISPHSLRWFESETYAHHPRPGLNLPGLKLFLLMSFCIKSLAQRNLAETSPLNPMGRGVCEKGPGG